MKLQIAMPLTLLLSAAPAAAETYECTYRVRGNPTWIPETATYTVDAGGRSATVQDANTRQHYSDAVPAELKLKGRNTVRLKWSLRDLEFRGQPASRTLPIKATYYASINTNTKKAGIRAAFHCPTGSALGVGCKSDLHANGICKRIAD